MVNQSIVFEQPINELVRACLRLEHLLITINTALRGESVYDTRAAISALIDILTLTDRPDLRGKFIKELMRQRTSFQRFIHQEQIDQTKLASTLQELDKYINLLQNNSGKFGSRLRDIEFLNNIRQHLMTSGGGLSFDTPAFYYWLSHPVKVRHAHFIEWLAELEDLFHIVQYMLRLIRQSGQPVLYTAKEGFFQKSLDPQLPCQLIIVSIPIDLGVFPEISVGRYGVGVRFYKPSNKEVERERPPLCEIDISFYMSCCVL
jgi:cell division protein ZapD